MTKEKRVELSAQAKKSRVESDRRIAYESAMRKIDPNFVGKFDKMTDADWDKFFK